MRSLYISKQGCRLSLKKETLILKKDQQILNKIQLPLVEQILIFGNTQVTTPAIRECLQRRIPIAYLSQTGRCYGRLAPIERRYPRLLYHQHQISDASRLNCARQLVRAKLQNSRTLLMRQRRRLKITDFDNAIRILAELISRIEQTQTTEALMGIEGAGAATYFKVFGHCLSNDEFSFQKRTRRPPTDPINAMLSFGYQLLWNHLLALIEMLGLDPYHGCLHQGSQRHAALASDLLEQFRAPLIDALVLYLANKAIVRADRDFDYPPSACYLNASGRKLLLRAFITRMETTIEGPDKAQPHWSILNRQVKEFIRFIYKPEQAYRPYLIR